jgi:hypothetical protein
MTAEPSLLLLMESCFARLIELGVRPVLAAELLLEPPVVLLSQAPDAAILAAEAENLGVPSPFEFAVVPLGDARAVAVNVMVHLRLVPDPALFDELYAASFRGINLVQCAPEGDWDVQRVLGSSDLLYRLRYSPGETSCLLNVQFLGDAAAGWRQSICG